jgi:hypothetical protein
MSVASVLAAESHAYQQALEAVRVEPDDEFLQQTLVRAQKALEVAWLKALKAKGVV